MKHQGGFISGAVIGNIVLGIVCLVFGSIMIWALVNYNDQKNNVDGKIQNAVELAKSQQKDADQKIFDEKEKNPFKNFVGPNDLGRVTFDYPKTWSLYIASDGVSGANYEAYFHPEKVPSTTGQNKFALRLTILNQSYEQVLQQYKGLVTSGQLQSQAVTTNGFTGTRFDGKFTQDVEGSAVIFKIRDKSLVLKSDSTAFKPDFDSVVVKSLKFDQ
jgi:hypothetical protein